MKHLFIEKLQILRDLSKNLPSKLKFGEFIEYYKIPGRKLDNTTSDYKNHYKMSGYNIAGAIFNFFEDKWIIWLNNSEDQIRIKVLVGGYTEESGIIFNDIVNSLNINELKKKIINCYFSPN